MARDPFLQPFDGGTVAGATTITTYGDPWNEPIGSGAVYADITDTGWIADTISGSSAAIIQGIDWAQATDPDRNFYAYNYSTSAWYIFYIHKVPDAMKWKQQKWGSATPPPGINGKDNPITVFATDKETFVNSFRTYRYSTFRDYGGPVISGADDKDIVIVHNASTTPKRYSGTSKGFSWRSLDPNVPFTAAAKGHICGGAIRTGELTTTNGVKHAVGFLAARKYLNYAGAGNGNPYVWPAAGVDNGAASTYAGNGNLYMGSRLALAADLNLSTLGLETNHGMELAKAAQDYGYYFVDSFADPGAAGIRADWAIIATDLDGWGSTTHLAFIRDVGRIANALKVITNNYASGGGAPTGNIPGGSTGTLRRVLLDGFSGGTPIPAAPTSHVMVNAVVGGWTSQWNASGILGETGFDLQYRAVPGSYPGSPQITNIPTDATERVVAGIAAGDYAAQVRSKNASGNSAWSNEATVTVPGPPTVPNAASDVAGVAIDYRTIDWTWTDNSTNEDEFKVQVSKNGGAYAQVASVGANATTYRYVDATPGDGANDYTAKVVASNATGDAPASPASDVVTTPSPPYWPWVYPINPVFPDAGSKKFPDAGSKKFPQ